MTLLLAWLLATAKPALEAAIVLHWTAVAGAKAYQLEIASDETFAEPLLQKRVNDTQYRWDDVPETRVYWRVRSVDAEARVGEWSESKEIQTVFVAPVPTRPKAQTFSPGERVRFEWTASKIFTSYRIEIAEEGGFAHPLVDKVVSEAHFVYAPTVLGNYLWRVRGIDFAERVTAPSPAQSFKLRAHLVAVSPATQTADVPRPASGAAATLPARAPATARAAPRPPPWDKPWQLGPSVSLGHNLHALLIYSLGLQVGYLRGDSREQVGFTLHFGFYPASQIAGRVTTQALVFPADIDFTYARVLGRVRLRVGLGLALNASVALVDVPSLPRLSQAALSPGAASFAGIEVPVGGGAFTAEVRLSVAPRNLTLVHFETGGLMAALGYLFYL